ncbi:MAG: helix-turn-helix domain-containing protein [Chloroflexi bacterium]|nr:helix-turn-helix domain-containing protein [Chloroflexota bacterium]
MPGSPLEQWLTVDQAAEYLGVTRRAIHKYVQLGKLPAFKAPVGGRTLFRRADLADFRAPRPIVPRGPAARPPDGGA